MYEMFNNINSLKRQLLLWLDWYDESIYTSSENSWMESLLNLYSNDLSCQSQKLKILNWTSFIDNTLVEFQKSKRK